MHLKEVEKLTGLSSKAIRLYEEKGLLFVERQAGNDYRIYTEHNIRTLRKIKVLRYLEFSVLEIKSLLELPDEVLKDRLTQKEQALFQQEDQLTDKLDVLRGVKEAIGKGSDWADGAEESIEFLEGDMMQDIKYVLLPSFWSSLFQTFLYTG